MARVRNFVVRNKVWIWPIGNSPWHFIYVDGKVKDDIIKVATPHHMGMIRVRATIGEASWETSLLPHKREDCFLLAIKKSIRQKEGIYAGDTVDVMLLSL
jgi:hypothetical protein